jgi:hypothetical protein
MYFYLLVSWDSRGVSSFIKIPTINFLWSPKLYQYHLLHHFFNIKKMHFFMTLFAVLYYLLSYYKSPRESATVCRIMFIHFHHQHHLRLFFNSNYYVQIIMDTHHIVCKIRLDFLVLYDFTYNSYYLPSHKTCSYAVQYLQYF